VKPQHKPKPIVESFHGMNPDHQTKSALRRAIKVPLILGSIFFVVVAVAWLTTPPSREELMGGTGKIWDLMETSAGGWCPNYMMGASSLLYDAFAVALFLSECASQLLGWILGPVGAEKALTLSFIPAAALTMWFFVRRLGCDAVASAWISLLYVVMPSFHVVMGIYEHRTVALCFVFAPMILRGILTVARHQAPCEIVLLGVAAAALALSYTKVAVVMSPMLLIWTLEVLRANRFQLRRALFAYGWSLSVAGLLALTFLLPALREFGFSAGFLFDPLDSWKYLYSFKTPLVWIDLWGFLSAGGDPALTSDAAMFWIGLIPLLVLSIVIGLPRLAEWRATPLGRWFLILTGCWLISLWFAAGPDGLLMGQIKVWKNSNSLPAFSIPILWLSFVWMAWLIYRTASQLLGRPVWLSLLVSLGVLAVPVFRLAELLPLFGDVRAPASFWSVGGFCCLAAAVGISFWILFSEVVAAPWRKRLAIATGLLMVVELYPVHSAYWTRGLGEELFTEYDEAAGFLKTAPIQGRVRTLGCRYFYLTLPQKAGRALDSEAAYRHFQLKWVRHLEVAGYESGTAMRTHLDLLGVAYILIDKEDPYTPKQVQDSYLASFPLVFENRYFAVLANPQVLYPAFLAKDFAAVPRESYGMAGAALLLLPQNVITVEMDGVDHQMPGYAGVAVGPNHIELLPKYQKKPGQPIVRVPLVGNRMDDYQSMTYRLPAEETGWLVVSEAYHPDWTVMIDSMTAEMHRSEAALLSVYVPPGSTEVVFQFKPPAWYSLCQTLGSLSWIVALAALLFLASKWAPAKWREWWIGSLS
jgi:hypothetical protein